MAEDSYIDCEFLGTGINWAGFQMIESTENMLNLITAKPIPNRI